MPRDLHLKVSATEVPQYRRLVDFLVAVTKHARETDDVVLLAMVGDCTDDLLTLRREDGNG